VAADDDDEPRFSLRQKIIAASAAAVLLIACYLFFPSFGGAGGSGVPVAATVSAQDLLRDYTVNSASAAKKYTIGHLVVTGEIAHIIADKRPRVRFKTEHENRFVEAVFGHPDELKGIEKNQKVTVRGECEGWNKNVVEITLSKVIQSAAN
jgi:hypothetical protein